MDDLKGGVSLNAYASRNPLTEYRIQGADLFDSMVDDIREGTVRDVLSFYPAPKREVKIVRTQVAKPLIEGFEGGKPQPKRTPAAKKVGRNDPCPCGSGVKYKNCCGRNS
jgi:preprotein translocase subunit SecA